MCLLVSYSLLLYLSIYLLVYGISIPGSIVLLLSYMYLGYIVSCMYYLGTFYLISNRNLFHILVFLVYVSWFMVLIYSPILSHTLHYHYLYTVLFLLLSNLPIIHSILDITN